MSTEQEDYDFQNRFFERAWNNQNRNNYNRDRAQEVYTDATKKNNDNLNDSRNDQDHDIFLNENNKKNENLHDIDDHFNEKFSYFLNENEYHIDTEMINQNNSKTHQCRKCKKEFSFNNKLHRHIHECRKKRKKKSCTTIESFHLTNTYKSNQIIVFKTKPNLFKSLTFRSWHFAIFFARIFRNESLNELCADSDCIMSLIDRDYLVQVLLTAKILHFGGSVTIRDIETVTHDCFEYVHLNLFISGFKEIVKLSRQTHVVDNLRAKFFMSMNILESEEVILNLCRRKMTLSLCENLKVDIKITLKTNTANVNSVDRIVLAERLISISAKFVASVSIRMKNKKTLSNRDYLFQSVSRELNLEYSDEIMTHVINFNVAAVQVCNVTNKSVIIFRRARLDRIIEYEEHECYSTDLFETSLAAGSFWRKSDPLIESIWRKIIVIANNQIEMKDAITTERDKTQTNLKEKSFNEIIAYELFEVRDQLFYTVNQYSALWNKTENMVIKLSENEWMSITLKSDVKIEVVKMYSMRFKKRDLIDETFDKLHQQNKMHWIKKFTTHEAFVFVVWRQLSKNEKKRRVIINIRELNKVVETDSYSMSLQTNIISSIADAKFISIIDAAVFFYQFRVKTSNRHKLTIVSHREQEYFFVAFMSFRNSSAYAQRRIDIILRDLKHCCRAFIDNITIFSSTLDEHIKHLHLIFQRLLEYNIKLNSLKAFLNFSSIALLSQHVDDFGLHAAKDKIAAILNWKFSVTLKALKIYLEFIEWLRDYVAWYAQKAKPLQQRKTLLLKSSSSQKDFVRKAYFSKTSFQFFDRELRSFELIQEVFKNSRFLTHFNLIRQFLIDVNVFKNEFEAFAYHLKREDMTKSTAIESIVFLSKILTSAEKRYWSTELKIAVVVWMIKKLHHMIRASKHSIIIWTDHSTTTIIVKQTKLSIINIDKLNLRLIRVVMYLSQFNLDVRHKSERDHVISNVLSRLSFFENEKSQENHDSNILNDIDAYAETLMKMSFIFRDRLVQAYKIDKKWSSLYDMLTTMNISRARTTRRSIVSTNTITSKISQSVNQSSSTQSTPSEHFIHDEIEFEWRNDLIYHLNRVTFKARLCISKSLIRNIFKMTHDDLAHVGFHRAHIIIFETLYIRLLAHYLRQYIEYCSECLLNQIKRHRSYDALIFICSSKISFHIITMNFILILSQSEQKKFDTMLIVTNKFSKDKLFISRRNTWKAQDWTVSLWKYLQLCNWDLSRVIIFDRDAKFRFDMWKSLFKATKTNLLTSTTYHSQTDDQNERINQTIEIALRYLLTSNSNLSWHETLSALQQTFMNTIVFTRYSSNQTLYEMNTRSQLTLLNKDNDLHDNQKFLKEIIRKDVADVIDFANARFKVIFDIKHQSIAFNTEDRVYLRLHHEYFLLEKENIKLSHQRSDSYVIKRKIERAAYELKLSKNARIHLVISIAQLKSTENDSDFFNRSRSTNSKSVKMNEDSSTKRSYEMKRILKERIRKYENITVKQYLIKWTDWKSEHNIWKSKKNCENVKHLILKFQNRRRKT